MSTIPTQGPRAKGSWLRAGDDMPVLVLLAIGLLTLYVPTYLTLSRVVWNTDDQGHGPLILGVCFWLLWRMRADLLGAPYRPATITGCLVLAVGLLSYVVGRSQEILQLEAGSQIVVMAGLLLLMRGPQALRRAAFPLFFMIFMVPMPGVFVQMLTVPLKAGVSYVVEVMMHALGYPIARSGVVLQVGQYQLLVADACAGLNSMFTLESLGLLYMNLMGYTSRLRNLLLAVLIIPISFCANVVRVVILVLVTFHFGDEAGQGFIHGFAGMLLFLVGLVLMLSVDHVVGRVLKERTP